MPIPVTLPLILEPINEDPAISEIDSTVPDLTPMSSVDLLLILNLSSIPPSINSSTATMSMLRSDLSTATMSSLLSNLSTTTDHSARYRISSIPDPLHHTASRTALREQNKELRELLKTVESQLSHDHALKIFIEEENAQLRDKLYH